MLPKAAIEACLSGDPTPIVPAHFFWFDTKFQEQHGPEVSRMRESYTDDFIQCGLMPERRAADPELEPGEFTDNWGCLFRAAPDGVGAHPTRPIVATVADWKRYVADLMPLIRSDSSTASIRENVASNPGRYVVASFWRTFYERMYMRS